MRALTALLSLASVLAHAEAIQVASLKTYNGTDGQLVDVARLAPLSNNAGLVRIRQSGSPYDGLVLRCEVDERSRFTTRFHGAPWTVVQLSDGKGRVYFPEVKEFSVTFSVDAIAKAVELIAEHEKQRIDGRLAMFAKKDFPHLTKKYEAKAAEALKKSCPGMSRFVFEWSSFSDADMENLDIWALCKPLVSSCKGTILVCRRGSPAGVTQEGTTVTLTLTSGGAK